MKALRVALTLSLLVAAVMLPAAQTAVVGLATFAPRQSVWDKALRQMRADWTRASQGRVTLRVFSGGSQGTESSVVRRMRIGQLQAAALTPSGLSEVDEAFNLFGIPFFFESDEEMSYVLDRLTPTLRQRLEKRNLVLLNWGHLGWAHIFTKTPLKSVRDLKSAKLFTSAGDDEMVQVYRRNGFTPVPLTLNDALMGLQTGLIEAYPSPPYAALLLQWYRSTPYMLDIAVGPGVGATVITQRAWNRFLEEDRARFLVAARRVEQHLAVEVPKQDRGAIVQLEKRGVTITRLEDPAVEAEFRSAGESLASSMRGSVVPDDILAMAIRERRAFRQRQASAGSR